LKIHGKITNFLKDFWNFVYWDGPGPATLVYASAVWPRKLKQTVDSPMFTWTMKSELIHSPLFKQNSGAAWRRQRRKGGRGRSLPGDGALSFMVAVLWSQEVFPATERNRLERCYSAYLLLYLSSIFRLSFLFCASFLLLSIFFLFCFLVVPVLLVTHSAGGSGKLRGAAWPVVLLPFSAFSVFLLHLVSILLLLYFSLPSLYSPPFSSSFMSIFIEKKNMGREVYYPCSVMAQG